MIRSIDLVIIAIAVVLSGSPAAVAAGYPKINLAVGYEVVPDWPERPETLTWRYMTGVAVDQQDRVWTLNAFAPQVQCYDTEGKLLDAWGTGLFKNPHFIRIDPEGNVWTTDYGQHTVRKFTTDGKLLMTLGVPDEAGADEHHFNRPTDVVVTPAGDIFVTDGYGNNRVVHFDREGRFVKAWGELGVEAGQLSQPHSIAVDSAGRLYVGERNNCRIQIFDQDGNSLEQWRNLINPWGIWITPNDEVYVCGSAPARWTERGNLGNPPSDQLLIKFDTEGVPQELWVFPLAKEGELIPGHLDWVHGIAVDTKGDLYLGDVADNSKTHRVQKFRRLEPEG
ncbi:MAG: hypothetical protein AMXMBFR82_15030 [Candidatus Hydrogenedentota bacterium]